MINRRAIVKGLAATMSTPAWARFAISDPAIASPELPLHFRSARALVEAIRKRDISSLALLEHYVKRLEQFHPQVNAIVIRNVETARIRAKAADAALARGESWGPLHGLPMTVKESFGVVGLPTTAGSPTLRDHQPTANATAVQRLLDAGAIIFGKTNVPIWLNDFQSYNTIYGTTNNPWDVSRTPGGSSGGSAAALAAGLTALELGSDLGGSIRVPAHFCGVYGHKPSFGLVPRRGQIPPPSDRLSESDLWVVGPLARHADDLDLAMDVLAGPDEREGKAWRLSLPSSRHHDLRAYRVAAWLNDDAYPVDDAVIKVLKKAIQALRIAGVTVDDGARPDFQLDDSHAVYYALVGAVFAQGTPEDTFRKYLAWSRTWAGESNHSNDARFIRGVVQRYRDWRQTQEKRERLRRAWATFFREVDVLLCPVTLVAAFPHDHSEPPHERSLRVNNRVWRYYDMNVWPGLATMPYLPATVAPVGLTESGLPVGIQIIGPYLEDRTTIDFARRMAKVVGGFKPPPGF